MNHASKPVLLVLSARCLVLAVNCLRSGQVGNFQKRLSPVRLELGHIRDGYPALAAWIGRDPDNETFVFRKFDRLSVRNLLHLKCQLIQLEDEIDKLDDEARKSSDLDTR